MEFFMLGKKKVVKKSKTKQPKKKLALVEELQTHQIELEMQNEELRRAQKQLQKLHDKYFDMYELAPIGYCVLDKNGLILEMNLTSATMLGKERGLLLQSPFFLYIAKKSRNKFLYYHRKVIETGKRHSCEVELVRKDGTRFPIFLEGTVIQEGPPRMTMTISYVTWKPGMSSTTRSVENMSSTTRSVENMSSTTRSVENVCRYPAPYFYSIMEMVQDAIVTFNDHWTITSWNRAAETLFGYSMDEVCGKPITAVISRRFGANDEINLKEADEGIWSTEIFETTGFSKNHGEFPVKLALVKGKMNGTAFFAGVVSKSVLQLKTNGIIGNHPSMHRVFNLIHLLQNSDASVLIRGESGTGKELFARALYRESRRAQKPFVTVNCGALPPGTLESELFGHVRGAFTGAVKDRKGCFKRADTGTIFLDEVGELTLTAQVQLLRVLEEGTFLRLGDDKITDVDVRVISATNKCLKEEVDAGRFRNDLYYRLCVFPIDLPPLRERRSDIPSLIDHFLRSPDPQQRQNISISPQALSALIEYQWPGNVRELQNTIQYALITCPGNIIEPVHLPSDIFTVSDKSRLRKHSRRNLNVSDVEQALQVTNGNKTKAALFLGVARATLYRFLSCLEINK